jgi:hypothetical protein
MLSFFKRSRDGEQIEAELSSQEQLLPADASSTQEDPKDVLDSLTLLSTMNGVNVVRYGARLAVVGELLVSVLSHLPEKAKAEVAASFRGRIEDLMAFGDDRVVPPDYEAALLTEVNQYLSALR